MRIRLEEIQESPTEASFSASSESVNERLAEGKREAEDFRLEKPLEAQVTYYMAGDDLYVHGQFRTTLQGSCARCLSNFEHSLENDFEFVLAPSQPLEEQQELDADDLALSFFSGSEIDLEPLVSEQMILSLPTRALCRDECQGLCAKCGADRNGGDCGCEQGSPDPRLAILREWKPR